MAEPTRFTSLEADAGGLPVFTTPSSIFDVPNTLLGGFGIGADAGSGFLRGAGTTFSAPSTGGYTFSFGAPGAMSPEGMSLQDLINPWNIRTDISTLNPNYGTWDPRTDVATASDADMTGFNLSGQPFNNAPIIGSDPRTDIGANVQTGSQETAIMMDPYKVTGTSDPSLILDPTQYVTPGAFGGNDLLGGVTTASAGNGVVLMDPFQVSGTKDQGLPTATINITGQAPTNVMGPTVSTDQGVETLPKVVVSATRPQQPTISTPNAQSILNRWNENIRQSVIVPPEVEVPNTKVKKNDDVNTNLPPNGTTPSGTSQTGATATSTTTTSSAMNQRDLKAELEKTMAAFNQYRPEIQKMYGELYQQFMPKGISQTEQGLIDQYKADLTRLQQRQAGMLSPEDVRQAQQSAREAYGARGQVMGPGAIGAELLNRESIRQQREDQARAGLQQSYGNILNMANIQTGNLFSPIASLMSGTFNPLGAYPADVYGTNVNAQLARDIAQSNKEAAIRSAELAGAAGKSAATTSAAGNILGPAIGGVAAKGLGALFGLPIPSCMPGDQCIDTPTGPKAIKDLKGGDAVIGYDGNVAFIAQACSWNQDPLRTFLTITREDGSSFTVCDDHKVMGIPAMEWVEGAELAGSKIKAIEKTTGLLTSYDILTNQGGYRINGIPVNSMIPEIIMQVVEFHRQVDRNLQAASA